MSFSAFCKSRFFVPEYLCNHRLGSAPCMMFSRLNSATEQSEDICFTHVLGLTDQNYALSALFPEHSTHNE